jgi:hypothetical protein
MLKAELNELDVHLKQLDNSLQEVYCILDEILSDPAKDYKLTFKKECFNIFNPTDLKEFAQVEKNKEKYLKLLLRYVMKKRIGKLSYVHDRFNSLQYEMLYALGQGEDPKDHKISKESKEEMINNLVKDGKKSRLLNENSYQVKNERINQLVGNPPVGNPPVGKPPVSEGKNNV